MKFFEPCWSHKYNSNGYIFPHTYVDLIDIYFFNWESDLLKILQKKFLQFEKIGKNWSSFCRPTFFNFSPQKFEFYFNLNFFGHFALSYMGGLCLSINDTLIIIFVKIWRHSLMTVFEKLPQKWSISTLFWAFFCKFLQTGFSRTIENL